MPEVPDTVDDAIEPLSSPSTDEVFEATRPFSAREIGSAAVSEALSGGGAGPSCLLGLTSPIDIHAVATHGCLWDRILDNNYDFNDLAELPEGLGLSTPADGSTEVITVVEHGTWAFTFEGGGSVADDGIRGVLFERFAGNCQSFGPLFGGPYATLAVVYELPAEATGSFGIETFVQATAGTYAVAPNVSITRLA